MQPQTTYTITITETRDQTTTTAAEIGLSTTLGGLTRKVLDEIALGAFHDIVEQLVIGDPDPDPDPDGQAPATPTPLRLAS